MALSRRTLFRRIGAGAAAGVGLPALARAAVLDGGRTWSGPESGDSPRPVRLHKNENAFGPSAAVIAAIHNATSSLAGRYPEAPAEALRRRIAALHTVGADQVVLGCGSDDVLCMAISAFGSNRKVIVGEPTYELVVARARRAATDVVSVPLRSDHSHDLEAMRSHADAATGLVYVCNPNNPTGSLTRRQELEAFIASLPHTTHVVVDEAYHHYVGGSSEYVSFIDRPVNDARVIVTRSFSAIYGLGGLRVGYAVAAPKPAALLSAIGQTNNVSGVSAIAAMAALDDIAYVRAAASKNADDLQEFCNQANARMLRTIDSHANFVMLNTGHPAPEMVEHFRKNGVLVAGPFHSFDKYIRVSLGTPAEMREFWRVWDLLPPTHMMTI